jgi:hypothetical protein
MEPEGSLPCSQEPATGLHPDPDASRHIFLKDKSLGLTKHHAMKTYWGVEV